MKRISMIICGLLFCFAAGFWAYKTLYLAIAPKEEPDPRMVQMAREAQYVREREDEYRRLLEQGTKELYEEQNEKAARRTLEQALDIALDDVQRYQAWRWLAEAAGETDSALRKRAGQQMAAIGKTSWERSEGLFVAATAQEKLGAVREAVREYQAAAAGYEKAGAFAEACRCLQYAADASLLPGMKDIKLCRKLLEREEKLLERVEMGPKKETLAYDLELSKADLERRERYLDKEKRKFAKNEGK
ncbi:hypothetical protein [Schwartzia sp. (in: firmicutes)]